MTITPDQAHDLLDGATPGPWRALHDQWEDEDGTPCEDFYVLGGPDGILHTEDFDPDNHDPVANTTLIAAAPDLAQFIAGMTELWLFQVKDTCSGDWETRGSSTAAPEDQSGPSTAENLYAGRETRWVRQYVTAPEAVDGE